jgi:hypothetical protein
VRVVDRAQVPLQSVTLGLPVMLVLACLLGLAGGVGASVLKNALVRRKHRGSAAWGVRRIAIGTQAPLDEGSVTPQDAAPPAAPPAAGQGEGAVRSARGEATATSTQA